MIRASCLQLIKMPNSTSDLTAASCHYCRQQNSNHWCDLASAGKRQSYLITSDLNSRLKTQGERSSEQSERWSLLPALCRWKSGLLAALPDLGESGESVELVGMLASK